VQQRTNVVIAGNGRLVAMRELDWTECDVVYLDVDSMDATALGIALNRTADLAGWDDEVLADRRSKVTSPR
jgi:ParB-like chromosome segregation protein Spo0J